MDDIQQVSIDSLLYPKALKKIPDAPGILYYRGFLPTEPCFAIVGTRQPSPYGQQVALQMAGDLSQAGLTIVSGLAPGIDTYAHTAAVEQGKKTIAVLGTGLDEKSLYPQQNLQLSRKIIENGGCLISELLSGIHGSKFTFPKRNRIISGLSLGVLIVEAKEKSGSLITARYANSQGKKLFAVPGSIFSMNSKGPNQLIKNGAKLVENANDILEDLGIQSFVTTQDKFSAENLEEGLILTVLQQEPLYIDAIIEKTHLSASEVATKLALMEISGKIRNLGGNVYATT